MRKGASRANGRAQAELTRGCKQAGGYKQAGRLDGTAQQAKHRVEQPPGWSPCGYAYLQAILK